MPEQEPTPRAPKPRSRKSAHSMITRQKGTFIGPSVRLSTHPGMDWSTYSPELALWGGGLSDHRQENQNTSGDRLKNTTLRFGEQATSRQGALEGGAPSTPRGRGRGTRRRRGPWRGRTPRLGRTGPTGCPGRPMQQPPAQGTWEHGKDFNEKPHRWNLLFVCM